MLLGVVTLGLSLAYLVLQRHFMTCNPPLHVQEPAFVETVSPEPVDLKSDDSRRYRTKLRSDAKRSDTLKAPHWACTCRATLSSSLSVLLSSNLAASTSWDYTVNFPVIDLELWISMFIANCWISCLFGLFIITQARAPTRLSALEVARLSFVEPPGCFSSPVAHRLRTCRSFRSLLS